MCTRSSGEKTTTMGEDNATSVAAANGDAPATGMAASSRRGDSLHLAASRGKLYRVAACLSKGDDPDEVDPYLRTPLAISCADGGHLEVARVLLRAGAEVNLRTPEGTPLEILLQDPNPNPTLVRELVLAGANLGCRDPKGYLPIQRAAANGLTAALRELLSSSSTTITKRRKRGIGKIDLDATVPQSGKTALVLGARMGHVEIVQMLLGAGASASLADRRGWTALHFASWKGHLRVVWELLGAGVNSAPLSDKLWTPLLAAALGGHSVIVRQLIGAGASVSERTSKGWNALHMASQAGHTDVVRALLVAGADVDAVGDKGWTALMTAAADGNGEIVRELLDMGADFDIRNDKGCTALIMASRNGFADVVRSFLELGADTTAQMTGGWTALSAACAGGHDLTAKYLLRAGADPNEQDDLGRTLLHDAAEDCRWDVVRELLRAGADPNVVTHAGETPLSLAGLGGSFEVIRELLQAGAEPLAVAPRAAAMTPRMPAKGVSPSTNSTISTASSSEKWRDYRFKAEAAASGVCPSGTEQSHGEHTTQLLHLGAKQGKHHPLLLELRRNTAPPEFPGARRYLDITTPTSRRRERGSTSGGSSRGPGWFMHSASA
ncbi:unnamed protein product [Ectocarpus sp. 6 AP-2014]